MLSNFQATELNGGLRKMGCKLFLLNRSAANLGTASLGNSEAPEGGDRQRQRLQGGVEISPDVYFLSQQKGEHRRGGSNHGFSLKVL